jgi:hypothetical protein
VENKSCEAENKSNSKINFRQTQLFYSQLCLQRHVSTLKSHHQAIHRTTRQIYQVPAHILGSLKPPDDGRKHRPKRVELIGYK